MRVLVVALLLLAPLGGCVEKLRGLEPDPPQATVLPWGLSGCTFVIGLVPVSSTRLAPHLPEGFRSLRPAEIGLPDDPRGDANLGFEAWRCNEGVGLNASEPLHDVSYGAVFTFAQPPEDRVVNGSRHHFVKWDVLEPDAERRALLLRHGVPAFEGAVGFARYETAGGLHAFDATLELNGTWSLRGTAAVAEDGFAALAFTEYSATPHGLVAWTTNATTEVAVAGTGSVQTDSEFFRAIVGSDRAQAYYVAGTGGAFTNGTITLPPLPLE